MKSLSNIPGQDTQPPRAFQTPDEEPIKKGVTSFWNAVEKAPEPEPKPYLFSDLENAGKPAPKAPAPEKGETIPEAAPTPELDVPAVPTFQDEARREAEIILQAAHADARLLRQQAVEEGRVEGYKAGYAQGAEDAKRENAEILEQKMAEALKVVAEAIHSIEVEKQQILDTHMHELRDLTLAIAEKVINVSLKSSGDIVERMIVAATERSKNQAWVKINLSSFDAEVMMQGDMSIISDLQNISSNVKIVAMDNAERGDCIIEFPDQIIDAGVRTQLDNIKEIMRAGENG